MPMPMQVQVQAGDPSGGSMMAPAAIRMARVAQDPVFRERRVRAIGCGRGAGAILASLGYDAAAIDRMREAEVIRR